MPRIQANRDAIDDRFSVLGFTVRTESPLFEVGIATDPALFRNDQRGQRNRRNFYSSRSIGAMRAKRGEAVYLVPPDVLSNFVGQQRLYFGLATYLENSRGTPDFVQMPSAGNMYVNLAGLTERGLRRSMGSGRSSGVYGTNNGNDESLKWGGDALPQGTTPTTVASAPTNGTEPVVAAPYDDGFGRFPAVTPVVAVAPMAPIAAGQSTVDDDDDDGGGIDEPIPDDYEESAVTQALSTLQSEYPQASRFVSAHSSNYRQMSQPRTIDRIVIHITAGGSRIEGTIGWFQNPNQRNRLGKPIHVSAHYIVGRAGEVVQMVRHQDKAIHAHDINRRSIGIEHNANKERGLNPTEDQYQASAALVAWLCAQFGLPIDREHIVGHAEADTKTSHDCPSSIWDWQHYMDLVRACALTVASPTAQPQTFIASSRALEIITPFYDPADPNSALVCQADAFSQAREEWFAGVPNTTFFPHSAICLLEMKDAAGQITSRGTGFYIGPNRILTCAHNLHGQSSVDIIPANNDQQQPFGSCNVASGSWRVSNRYPAEGHNFDLAVIDNVPISAPGGRWFEFLQATPGPTMPIVVCGYSSRSNAVPALTQLINGRMQHLHGGYVGAATAETFDYNILTLKRASGSPVYNVNEVDGQLKALVCGVHVSGEPAALGLNRGCFITPNKIDWIEGRTTALASGALGTPVGVQRVAALSMSAIAIHWDTVPYWPQTNPMSCWAASAAMVVGWRDQVSIADSEIARMVPVIDAYRTGLWPRQRQQLANAWNLVAEPPASYTVTAWAQMLEAYGPIYIDMTASGNSGGHVRVLVGMESDGNADGSGTTMYMYDPWPGTPGKIKLSFADFLTLYEGRVGNSGGQLEYQILHADSIPASLSPVTSAPFSLTLAEEAQPALDTSKSETPRLPAPPAPIVQQQQLITKALVVPAAAIEIASVVLGATMERVANNDGDVHWELDQLRGYKHPNDIAPNPMPAANDGLVIRLTDWPYFENHLGDRISAGFEINWQYNGKCVGNVMISNVATNDAVGWGLSVKAKIMDDNIVYPRDNPSFAALRVRFEYRFTRSIGGDLIAIQDVHLFGNGRYNTSGRWEQK